MKHVGGAGGGRGLRRGDGEAPCQRGRGRVGLRRVVERRSVAVLTALALGVKLGVVQIVFW